MCLLYIRLLFKNKLFVSILGLYAGASSAVWFSQANEINFLIAKTVNESSFIILGGNFNEDGSHKCASFKKSLDLGLVNSLVGSLATKMPTWINSKSVEKTIDYVFISPNLINAVVYCGIFDVSEHFDTDYQAVSVSLELGRLLDTHLISLHKQANRDHWKFDIKNTNKTKWFEFRDNTAANAVMFSDAFGSVVRFSDLDTMWDIIRKIIFKGFDGVFTKKFFRFHKLELLVSKLVKALRLFFCCDFVALLNTWDKLDSSGALTVKSLFLLNSNFDLICFVFAKMRKLYCAAKLLESKCAEESHIKQAIAKKMESFELDKGHIIRNVLEHPFHKVVLNHLVIRDELILEPNLVKSKVDDIMEGWTRRCRPLEYVFNSAFSGVMCLISFDKMSAIVKNLPDGKAAGLFGISNELWKHCNKVMTDFRLTDGYYVHDGLDQEEVFSPLFWCIFYNSLLCEVKKQKNVYGYRLNSHFIFKTGQVDSQAGLISFLAAGAFVNNTIWIGNSQTTTQYILDVASEFFRFNDIFINNDKTMAIPINCQVTNSYLTINSSVVFDIHQFHGFGIICNDLLATDAAHFSVYMDGSLCGLSTIDIKAGAVVFFQDINSGLGVKVFGLVSSTLMKLQTIALALECVSSF
ncbi:hypothetical protein G9A89_021404 [Geosiphon pyriformis]|nr:hypothetical protein G9A89_021404 [Geosiphon pyriformis]